MDPMVVSLIVGNCISFAAAIFTAMASWTRKPSRTYLYQCIQCLLLAVASVFFRSYAGIATLLLCALRNILIAKGYMHLRILIPLLAGLVLIGAFVNNRGFLGWFIIAGTGVYSVLAAHLKKELHIKINIAVNLTIWVIYELLIRDIASTVMDSIVLVITFVSICFVLRDRKRGREYSI